MLITISVLGTIYCLILLFFGDLQTAMDKTSRPTVGEVTFGVNDVRQKNPSSFVWNPVYEDQKLKLGDAIYSGSRSQVNVALKTGDRVHIGENSMVKFGTFNKQQTIDFENGNFRIKVNGTLNVSVRGELTTLQGSNSEVQLVLGKDKKAKLKLLKGNVEVKKKSSTVKLQQNKVTQVAVRALAPPIQEIRKEQEESVGSSLVEALLISSSKEDSKAESEAEERTPASTEVVEPPVVESPVETVNLPEAVPETETDLTPATALATQAPSNKETKPATIEVPKPQAAASATYTWKLYDLYEQKEAQLVAKKYRPTQVALKVPLSWRLDSPQNTKVEWADNPAFQNAKTLDINQPSVDLASVFLGDNFWHVSTDGAHWSGLQKFTVDAQFSKGFDPVVLMKSQSVPLLGEAVSLTVPLQAPSEILGFVAQASLGADFNSEQTRTFWSMKPEVDVSFYRPGKYFYRFRSVNKKQELSRWSSTVEFDVFVPRAPKAPLLKLAKKTGIVGEKINLRLASDSPHNQLQIFNEKNKKVAEYNSSQATWVPKEHGKYKIHSKSMNQYGQQSPVARPTEIEVRPLQPVTPIVEIERPEKPKEAKEPKRKTASVENPESASSMKVDLSPSAIINDKYKSSTVSANGYMWTAFSSEQMYQEKQNPVASGLGARAMLWKDHQGFEGQFKAGVLGLNETGKATSMKDLEMRYHYRIFTGFPFGWSRELQTSLFAGYQVYRNSGGLMSSEYDLMKFGTSLEFPWSRRWSMGGEFVYGRGTEGSNKQEISGHFNYYLSPAWSVGSGYRVHLFEAGSPKASPSQELPYREGYTEGYSVINYHF